jgi:hypothetical protein
VGEARDDGWLTVAKVASAGGQSFDHCRPWQAHARLKQAGAQLDACLELDPRQLAAVEEDGW